MSRGVLWVVDHWLSRPLRPASPGAPRSAAFAPSHDATHHVAVVFPSLCPRGVTITAPRREGCRPDPACYKAAAASRTVIMPLGPGFPHPGLHVVRNATSLPCSL